MKIVMEELERALTLASYFLKPRSPLRSAEWFMIKPYKYGITIRASDPTGGNIIIEVATENPVEKEFCVSAKLFKDMVSSLGAGDKDEIDITLDGNTITLKSGKRKYTLQTQDSSEFPHIDRPKGYDVTSKIDVLSFEDSVRRGSISVNKDHPVLENIWIGDGKVVSADGVRMSIVDSDNIGDEILLPMESATVLLKLIKHTGDIDAGLKDSKLYLNWNDGSCMFLTVVHSYPNHNDVLDTMEGKLDTTVLIDRDGLLECMNALTVVSQENDFISVFEIVPGSGVIRIWSKSGLGQFDDEVHAKAEGQPCSVAVSSKLLSAALRTCPKGETTLRFGSESAAPVLLYDKANGATHLIMSMQIK